MKSSDRRHESCRNCARVGQENRVQTRFSQLTLKQKVQTKLHFPRSCPGGKRINLSGLRIDGSAGRIDLNRCRRAPVLNIKHVEELEVQFQPLLFRYGKSLC